MKDKAKSRHNIVTIIFLLIIGSVFVALGIGILAALIKSWAREDVKVGAFALVPLICFVALPIAMGSVALSMSIKEIYHWVRETQTAKSDKETTATLIDYKIVSYNNGSLNKRYALKLSYELDGETKIFTTDYIFDINEFKYLQSLDTIKIKVDGQFVAVAEKFDKEIYKIDPMYGIERAFFEQPPVKRCFSVLRIAVIIAVILLFASIILTAVLENGIFLIVGVSLFCAVNVPFAIILAIYFIKWFKRKE